MQLQLIATQLWLCQSKNESIGAISIISEIDKAEEEEFQIPQVKKVLKRELDTRGLL